MATATYALPGIPFFLQKKPGDGTAISYTAADFRRYTAALNRREGILGAGDFIVDQAPNVGWSVLVNSGYAHVGYGTGQYLVSLSADAVVPLTGFNTSPASTRTHKVWLVVYDAMTIGTTYGASIVITEDVGAGAPTPDNAAAYLLLATVSITSNQSYVQRANINNVALHGGGSGVWQDLSSWITGNYQSAGDVDGSGGFRGLYTEGTVRLAGTVQYKFGTFKDNTAHVIGNMYSRLRPKSVQHLVCPCSYSDPGTTAGPGTYSCQLKIEKNGTMTIYMPKGQTPTWVYFDGVTYDLD